MKNKWLWAAILVVILGISIFLFRSGRPQSTSVKDKLNSDGIRIDVAEFIDRTYPSSEKTRAAAKQIAMVFQKAIEHPENALAISAEDDKATSCAQAIFQGDAMKAVKLALELESVVVNSSERSRAYIKYNSNLSGQIFGTPPDDINQCEFAPSQMKD